MPQGTLAEQKIWLVPHVAGMPFGSHLPQDVHTLSGPQSSSDLHLATHAPALQYSSAPQLASSVHVAGATYGVTFVKPPGAQKLVMQALPSEQSSSTIQATAQPMFVQTDPLLQSELAAHFWLGSGQQFFSQSHSKQPESSQ